MEILFLNFVFYFLWLIVSYKIKGISIYTIAVFWVTFIAFMGFYSFFTGIYTDVYGDNGVFAIKPLIWGFISFFLILLPLSNYGTKRQIIVGLKSMYYTRLKYFGYFLLFICVLLCIAELVKVENVLSDNGLADAYARFHEEGGTAFKLAEWQSKIYWLFRPIQQTFFWFIIIVSILKWNSKSNDYHLWLFIAIFSVSYDLLDYISRSARGEILYLFMKFLLFFSLVWSSLHNRLKRVLLKISCVVFIFFGLYTIFITIDRFSDSQGSGESIIRYLGEPFPNLSNQLWDNVMRHPYGLRMFPYLLGYDIETKMSSWADYHDYWAIFTGVSMANFKTIYGDFYVEFGEYGGMLSVFVLSTILFLTFRTKKINMYMYPILSIYIHLIVLSPLFFSYRGYSKFMIIVDSVIGVLFVKYVLCKKEQNVKKTERLY